MKRIFTVGVFDMLHIGHIELFRRAKELGDYLIVAVQDSINVLKYKPEANLMYSTEQRKYMIDVIKFVDEVVVYSSVDLAVKENEFDIFVIGPDQNHTGFQNAIRWCEENNKKVVILSRTEGISSSLIKKKLSNSK